VPAALADPATTTGYTLSADLGGGHTVLPPDVELQWQRYGWSRYGWSRYGWSRYGWSRYGWSRYGWSRYAWSIIVDGE